MTNIYKLYGNPLDISLGRVLGVTPSTTTGYNGDIDSNAIETIWPHGGLYTPLTTAENVYIVSTSTSDTVNSFTVEVLQEDYTAVTLQATPNGRTPVLLQGGTYKRFNKAINVSGTASQGTVYIYSGEGGASNGVPNDTAKIMARIDLGKEISQNAVYTVPKGKALVANTVRAYIGKNKDCGIFIYVYTKDNPVPFELIEYQMYQNILQDDFYAPQPYTEGTTFEFRASSENMNTTLTVSAASLLVDV